MSLSTMQIAEILFEYDPMGLDFGQNADEYTPEARKIFSLLKEAKNIEHLTDLVHGVFVEMFNVKSVDAKPKVYSEIAEKLWEQQNLV